VTSNKSLATCLANAAITCDELGETLAVPPILDPCEDESPSSPRWRHQSLSKGAAGVAILHGVRARTASGRDNRVHAWLARAVSEDLTIGPGAGLWFGAPAVAFTLALSAPDQYRQTARDLEAGVQRLTQARLDTASTRMAMAARPTLSEFDLVRGLTGLGAHLLVRDPDGTLIRRVLRYLVCLTEPVPAPDDAGTDVPGWWTSEAPSGQPDVCGGHADLGVAHGICGPLALLAISMRRGVTVDGHAQAIDRICHWLDTWQQRAPAGPWWPERITFDDLLAGRPSQTRPLRPSWCYGTPGLARAQQLAALARHDLRRQAAAEHALAQCLADPAQLSMILDPNLCHGQAGLAITAWYAAAEALTSDLSSHLPHLLGSLIDHANASPPHLPGLIEGSAGIALALHAIVSQEPSDWPVCLLIN
jgi:lantibiotic biosynthesis protein